jgi:hypothetical protein
MAHCNAATDRKALRGAETRTAWEHSVVIDEERDLEARTMPEAKPTPDRPSEP